MNKEKMNTCLIDVNTTWIYEGDEVFFFGKKGKVVKEFGCYGIIFEEMIDWDDIEKHIKEQVGNYNSLYACLNDNFISFWEIAWNFECEEDFIHVVEVVSR